MGAAPTGEGEGETRAGTSVVVDLKADSQFMRMEDVSCVSSQTASEEEPADGGGHVVRDSGTDAHQTQVPGRHHPEQVQKGAKPACLSHPTLVSVVL